MKTFLAVCCVGVFLPLAAALPVVKDITLATDVRGDVTVSYTVDAMAIVTADFLLDGEPINPANIAKLSGAIGVLVAPDGMHTFRWLASLDLPDTRIDDARLQVRLTPFAPFAPPDYAVVSLLTNAPNPIVYYASTNHLPGGLFANDAYRTTKMVFRKIEAKGVEWLMGSTGQSGRNVGRETPHLVTLDHDYYIGIFELTKAQYAALLGKEGHSGSAANNADGWKLKPLERTPFAHLRGLDEMPSGAIGNLRARTGLSIDLPSEAEWEFAARAGNDESHWPNGAPFYPAATNAVVKSGSVTLGASNPADQACMSETSGGLTRSVGSFAPNGWGLYDVMGNVAEMCLDAYMGTDAAAMGNRVTKGGHFSSKYDKLRPASRDDYDPTTYKTEVGYRLCFAIQSKE